MGTDLRAFLWIQRALEQRAKDGRLNHAPIECGDGGQRFDFTRPELDRRNIGKQAAVEVEDLICSEVATVTHGLELTFRVSGSGNFLFSGLAFQVSRSCRIVHSSCVKI